jgi:hypothetical protein
MSNIVPPTVNVGKTKKLFEPMHDVTRFKHCSLRWQAKHKHISEQSRSATPRCVRWGSEKSCVKRFPRPFVQMQTQHENH